MLLGAGIPLLESLRLVEEQTQKRSRLLPVVRGLSEAVVEGKSLSFGFQQFAQTFGGWAVSLVEVGELSGTLPEHLQYWNEQLAKQQRLGNKMRTALVYPAVVLIVALGVVAFLFMFVFPKLLPIFATLKFELPFATRILLGTYNSFTQHGGVLLGGVAAGLVVLYMAVRSGAAGTYVYGLLPRVPVIGRLLVSYEVWHICRTLAVLINADMPLVRSVTMVAQGCRLPAYSRALFAAAASVSEGNPLARALAGSSLFPRHAIQLLSAGEQTGRLSHALLYTSEMLEQETEDALQRLSVLFEPALLLFVALIVGFVAIAVITPIYGITESLHF